MFITTAESRPSGDQPNEDYHLVTDDLVVVLDGATIRTDTGCIHTLSWFTRQLGTSIAAAAVDSETPLTEALATAIRQVAGQHSATCDLEHPGTPSAAVGVVRRTGDKLEWLVLGDITVMVETKSGLEVTSDDRVSQVAVEWRRECDRYLLGTDEKAAAIQAFKPHELAARNTQDGFWIASVLPEAAQHAYTGSVELETVRRAAVCSDGAMRALELTSISSHSAIMGVLRGGGPGMLIDQVRLAEGADPTGRRVPRNKGTDDATAVHLEVPQPVRRRPTPKEREAALAGRRSTHGLLGACPTVDGRNL